MQKRTNSGYMGKQSILLTGKNSPSFVQYFVDGARHAKQQSGQAVHSIKEIIVTWAESTL